MNRIRDMLFLLVALGLALVRIVEYESDERTVAALAINGASTVYRSAKENNPALVVVPAPVKRG